MKTASLAFAGVALFASAASALASDAGWYVGVGNGFNLQSDVAAKMVAGGTTLSETELSFEPTWRGIATFGYATAFRLRVEGEVGYTHPVFEQSSANWMLVDRADFRVVNASTNVLYDHPIFRDWSLTAGFGAGYGWTRIASLGSFERSKGTLTGQAIAGVGYRLTDLIDAQFDYRYVMTQGVTYENMGGSGIDGKMRWTGSHNVMLTLRLYFDRSPVAVPAQVRRAVPPLPPPPPPRQQVVSAAQTRPMLAPPVTTYIVYFGFNEASLTEDARGIVAQAVNTARMSGLVKVLIVGHADNVGTDRYNMRLSVARAQSVKDEMMREGLDGSSIAILGRGFRDPIVSTGPGVREPQNRRAVISLGG